MHKIGEEVKIVDAGQSYDFYDEWFCKHNEFELLERFDSGNELIEEEIYVVVARHMHTDDSYLLYALKNKSTGLIYLMDEHGFESV